MSNEKTDENHVWFSSVFSKLIHMMNLAIFIVYQTYELKGPGDFRKRLFKRP